MELPPDVCELESDGCDFGSAELPPPVAAESPTETRPRPKRKKRATSAKNQKNSRKNAHVEPRHFPLSGCPLPDPVPESTLLSYWSSMGVELPPDCGGDGAEDDDFFVLENVDNKARTLHHVPGPLDLMQVGLKRQVAAEYYSPPRVLPCICSSNCILSLDILTGWDFTQARNRQLSLDALKQFEVDFCVLSPPCTMFSCLQILFKNFEKMDPAVFQRRWHEAEVFMKHSMDVADQQLQRQKFFALEHPRTATSWKLPCVEKISLHGQVQKVHFDQCMLGLKAPCGKLFKKRTTIMSNSSWLVNELAKYQCDKSHEHQPIEGQENGRSRSWWAQHYPPALCKILAEAAER